MRVQLGAQRGDQRAALLVDRALTAEKVIVFSYFQQPLARDVASARYPLQERHYLVGVLRPAEAQHQQRVEFRLHFYRLSFARLRGCGSKANSEVSRMWIRRPR